MKEGSGPGTRRQTSNLRQFEAVRNQNWLATELDSTGMSDSSNVRQRHQEYLAKYYILNSNELSVSYLVTVHEALCFFQSAFWHGAEQYLATLQALHAKSFGLPGFPQCLHRSSPMLSRFEVSQTAESVPSKNDVLNRGASAILVTKGAKIFQAEV